ncbi:MAG: porin [Janthinobacterium lividum]
MLRLSGMTGLACMSLTSGAFAQSSVTLYGVVDNGLVYASNQASLGATQGGHSIQKMAGGIWAGSRWGVKGSEDLGDGTRALFQLESGFNSTTGGAQYTGAEFGRQAYVGLANKRYGSLTAGRQYSSYYALIAPYSPTTWLTGYFGAHPGDIDSMDTDFRHNNALVYQSPTLYGFTTSFTYALGGVAGQTNAGATWSAALQYQHGPFGIAAAIQRIDNATSGGGAWGANSTTSSGGQAGVSALTNGYQTNAAQQRVAVAGGYAFTEKLDVSFTYSNVQYIPGIHSSFTDTAVFNTGGAVLHYRAARAVDLAAGYSYTRATKANGIEHAALYHQVTLSQAYTLSKRTTLYVLEAYQLAHGDTLGTAGAGHIISATATLGDGFQSTPSSSNKQFAAGLGIVHRF